MAGFAPPAIVDGPARTGFPYGLFSLLSFPDSDVRWQNGVTWTATCDPANGRGIDCDNNANTQPVGLPKTFDGVGSPGDASPFAVYGSFTCSPIGTSFEEAQQRATDLLLAREEARVEQALWTGDLGNVPSLSGSQDLTGGTAVTVVQALTELEHYLSQNYGSQGVIHIPRAGLISLGNAGVLRFDGDQAFTEAGTPVVAGAGYPNVGPTGSQAPDGEMWVYASPALFGYRGEVLTSSNQPGDLLDRDTNDMYAIAERMYLLGFDPCGTAAARFTVECC